MQQENGLLSGQGALQILAARGDQRGDKGKNEQVLRAQRVRSRLLAGHQGFGLQQLRGAGLQPVNGGFLVDQEAFQITAPPAQGHIILVWVSERRGPQRIVRHILRCQAPPKGQLHRLASHDAPHALKVAAAHAIIGMR